jgi:hypothetical protein
MVDAVDASASSGAPATTPSGFRAVAFSDALWWEVTIT